MYDVSGYARDFSNADIHHPHSFIVGTTGTHIILNEACGIAFEKSRLNVAGDVVDINDV